MMYIFQTTNCDVHAAILVRCEYFIAFVVNGIYYVRRVQIHRRMVPMEIPICYHHLQTTTVGMRKRTS